MNERSRDADEEQKHALTFESDGRFLVPALPDQSTAQSLFEVISRGNNTISYSRDRSATVTDTTASITLEANNGAKAATNMDFSEQDQSLENVRLANRAIDSLDISAKERVMLRRKRK